MRRAKLGSIVFGRKPVEFELWEGYAIYWDRQGRPTNKHGKLLFVDELHARVLDTEAKVERYNKRKVK